MQKKKGQGRRRTNHRIVVALCDQQKVLGFHLLDERFTSWNEIPSSMKLALLLPLLFFSSPLG